MSRAIFGLLLIGAALLQATLLRSLGPVAVTPNLVLVMVLVRTVKRGVPEGLLWALVGGLALDVLALDPLGTNGLALVPVVLCGGIARRRVFQSGVLFGMLLAIGASLAHALVLNGVRVLGGESLVPMAALLRLTFLQALLNAVLVPIVWPLVGLIGRFEPERGS